jgi:hypothetical protein
MKKGCLLLVVSGFLFACNDSASVNINIDSTGKKFENKAEKVWDSTKEGLKDLKESTKEGLERLKDKAGDKLDRLDSSFDAKRDSLRKKKTGN